MKLDTFLDRVMSAEKQGVNKGFVTMKLLEKNLPEWTDLTNTSSDFYKFINSVLFKDQKKH